MVWWIWVGGGVMALGTLMSAVPSRRRDRDIEEAFANEVTI